EVVRQGAAARRGRRRDGPSLAQGPFTQPRQPGGRDTGRQSYLFPRDGAVQELVVGRPPGAHRPGAEDGPQPVAAGHESSVICRGGHALHCCRFRTPLCPGLRTPPFYLKPLRATKLTVQVDPRALPWLI